MDLIRWPMQSSQGIVLSDDSWNTFLFLFTCMDTLFCSFFVSSELHPFGVFMQIAMWMVQGTL